MLKRTITLLASILLLSATGMAAPELELNGLIIDQTRTRIGQEIYRQFSNHWGSVRVNFPFNISIREIPDARWGSIVAIEVNGRTAYRNILRPRTNQVGEEVNKAISQVRGYLLYLVRTNGRESSRDLKGNGY